MRTELQLFWILWSQNLRKEKLIIGQNVPFLAFMMDMEEISAQNFSETIFINL